MPRYTKETQYKTGSAIGDTISGYLQARKDMAEINKLNRAESNTPDIKDLIFAKLAQDLNLLPSAGGASTTQLTQPKQPGEDTRRQIKNNDIPSSPFRSGEFSLTGLNIGGLNYEDIGTALDKRKAELDMQASKELNVMERKPAAERKGEAEAIAPTIDAIFSIYNDAFAEVSKDLPNVGEAGIEGWVDRQKAKIGASEFLQKYPKLSAYEDSVKAYATDFAKSAGEVRPTDVDIERFAKILFTVTKGSRAKNLQKAKNQVSMMKAKNVNVEWAENMLKKIESAGGEKADPLGIRGT